MKEDRLQEDLSRIHQYIGNCDNKLSIALGSTLTITTLLLSFFKEEICNAISHLFVTVLLISTLLVLSLGVIHLLMGLWGRTNSRFTSEEKSLIYFGDIAGRDYSKFHNAVKCCSDEDYYDDLIHQIHINSVICTKKFEYYNKGLVLCSLSWGLMLGLIIACYLV